MLPPIKSVADIGPAMDAVTSALAAGTITSGEAATIAAVVDTSVRATEASDFERRLKIMEAEYVARCEDIRKCSAPDSAGNSTARREFAVDPL